MALYLASKEVWRNRGRFFVFSLVIVLITTLVLFIAALSEGLALANKEYLEKLDADLLVFQKNVELSANTSRIGRSKINDISRVEGVQAVGSIGFSNATIVYPDGRESLNISLIGVEARQPGSPPVLAGQELITDRGFETVIDINVAEQGGVGIGDTITIKTIQGTQEEFYKVRVVGITSGRQYLFLPSVFLPYRTWDQIRPQAGQGKSLVELTSNVLAVKIDPDQNQQEVHLRIMDQVEGIEVTDIKTAFESIPGFQAQQSTLNTQRAFTLIIGILIIGGFFQIQILQKIPQIGVLKAIGTPNGTIALSVVIQIIIVTSFGVLLGSLVTFGLALGMPTNVPVIFNGASVAIAVLTLLLIGPLGGLVSVRLAISVEPLIALGLSN